MRSPAKGKLICRIVDRAEAKNGAALIDHVYMDAMGFGMGCSCLQLTFQACNVTEARRLYDAFVPLAPILVTHFFLWFLELFMIDVVLLIFFGVCSWR